MTEQEQYRDQLLKKNGSSLSDMDKVNWRLISEQQTLSEDFILELIGIVEELKENPDTNGTKRNITKGSKSIPLDYDEAVTQAGIANMEEPAVYSSSIITEFKAKTEDCFKSIDGLGANEIEEMMAEYVNSKLAENDFDASVRDVVVVGSRCRGLEGKESDLDVVVEYTGDEKEDDIFNLLHEDNFKIRGVLVDINPITKYKTGTLEEYLPGVEKYLEEKSKIEYADKIDIDIALECPKNLKGYTKEELLKEIEEYKIAHIEESINQQVDQITSNIQEDQLIDDFSEEIDEVIEK